MASFLDIIKADARRITSDPKGVTRQIRFVSRKPGRPEATILGLHTRHHEPNRDAMGAVMNNDPNAHISFSAQALEDEDYPVRTNSEVDIKGDVCYIQDASGVERKYLISQVHPDETIDQIRCILSDCA